MKIIPIDIIKSMSGKVCQHSDTSVVVNSSSGRMHTAKMCNPYMGPATMKQEVQKSKFALQNQALSAWLNANKPKNKEDKGSAQYQWLQKQKKALQLSNIRQVLSKYQDKETFEISLPEAAGEGETPVVTPGSGEEYSLNIAAVPAEGGIVEGMGMHEAGKPFQIKATANEGFRFSRWDDGDTNPVRTITLTDNKVMSAYFDED